MRLADNWRGIDFYIVSPSLSTPDFFWWGHYTCCTKETLSRIECAVIQDTVPLPVRVAGTLHDYVLLFVRNEMRISWNEDLERAGQPIKHASSAQQSHSLQMECFNRPQLFISTDHEKGQVFCVSACGDERSDFYLRYQALGLTGVSFIPVHPRGNTIERHLVARETAVASSTEASDYLGVITPT